MPKKIIIASTEIATGGLGSYLVTLARGLESRGWEVHLLVTNVHSKYFGSMAADFNCHNLSTIALSPKKVFITADLVNSIIPDVILTNNCALMQYATPLIAPAIKTISVLHSDDSRFYAIAALFPERVFRWIAPTAGLASRFREFVDQGLYEKIRIIPHGVDRRRFFPEHNGDNGSSFRILFVGFLGESKGANLLPEIFQKIASAIPEALFTIIGDGPLSASLGEEFKKRGMQNKIVMRDVTSPDQTAEAMRASQILILPTNLEGFGIVIVEAMMCGVVPVVSRLTGITDQLVRDGETGFLVPPRDVNEFVEAVKRIHRDSELFRVMSTKALKTAAEKFSVDTMVDRYEALFSEPKDRDISEKRSLPVWYVEAAIQFLRKRLR